MLQILLTVDPRIYGKINWNKLTHILGGFSLEKIVMLASFFFVHVAMLY